MMIFVLFIIGLAFLYKAYKLDMNGGHQMEIPLIIIFYFLGIVCIFSCLGLVTLLLIK